MDHQTDTIRLDSCVQAVAALTDPADPTYAGQLRIGVLPRPGAQWVAPLSAATGAFYTLDVNRIGSSVCWNRPGADDYWIPWGAWELARFHWNKW